jgi:hypothetical protein
VNRVQLDPAPCQTSEATSPRLDPQLVVDLTKIGVRGLLPVAPPGSVMSPNSNVEPGAVVEGALADLLNFPLKRVGRAPKFAVPCTYDPDQTARVDARGVVPRPQHRGLRRPRVGPRVVDSHPTDGRGTKHVEVRATGDVELPVQRAAGSRYVLRH